MTGLHIYGAAERKAAHASSRLQLNIRREAVHRKSHPTVEEVHAPLDVRFWRLN